LQVNDTVIQNMTVNEAIALIRGKRGTTVRLLIQRGNQPPFSVSIVRDKIVVPSVETRMLEDNTIAYVKLNQFTATATDELHQMLEQVMALHPEGLIFDLRNDPGGYLNVAVDVGSEFLKEDQVLLLERRKTGRDEELRTHGGGVATDIPMVLLINGGSASASEIIAAALKDYKRATLIGTKTYGKGSVQVTHALSDGSQLHVTIAHWLSPLGHEINQASVLPDIEVDDPTPAEDSKNIDRQLDRAIEFLKSQSAFDANPWRLFALPAFVPAPLP
jgi:carboxyl-terminal processing protease